MTDQYQYLVNKGFYLYHSRILKERKTFLCLKMTNQFVKPPHFWWHVIYKVCSSRFDCKMFCSLSMCCCGCTNFAQTINLNSSLSMHLREVSVKTFQCLVGCFWLFFCGEWWRRCIHGFCKGGKICSMGSPVVCITSLCQNLDIIFKVIQSVFDGRK